MMEHLPAARTVTVVSATMHTAGVVEVKLTVRPELAVAVIANGGVPRISVFNGGKAMV
jgi:hypothetical protein